MNSYVVLFGKKDHIYVSSIPHWNVWWITNKQTQNEPYLQAGGLSILLRTQLNLAVMWETTLGVILLEKRRPKEEWTHSGFRPPSPLWGRRVQRRGRRLAQVGSFAEGLPHYLCGL